MWQLVSVARCWSRLISSVKFRVATWKRSVFSVCWSCQRHNSIRRRVGWVTGSVVIAHMFTIRYIRVSYSGLSTRLLYRTRNRNRLWRKWSGKRSVLRQFWKTVSVEAEVMSGSRLFHGRLPATGNARSPTVESCVCGRLWFVVD